MWGNFLKVILEYYTKPKNIDVIYTIVNKITEECFFNMRSVRVLKSFLEMQLEYSQYETILKRLTSTNKKVFQAYIIKIISKEKGIFV